MVGNHFRSLYYFQGYNPLKLFTHGVGAFLMGVFVKVTVADGRTVSVIVDVSDGGGVLLGVDVEEGTSV